MNRKQLESLRSLKQELDTLCNKYMKMPKFQEEADALEKELAKYDTDYFADDEEEPADEEADETEAAEDAAENEEIKEEK